MHNDSDKANGINDNCFYRPMWDEIKSDLATYPDDYTVRAIDCPTDPDTDFLKALDFVVWGSL